MTKRTINDITEEEYDNYIRGVFDNTKFRDFKSIFEVYCGCDGTKDDQHRAIGIEWIKNDILEIFENDPSEDFDIAALLQTPNPE